MGSVKRFLNRMKRGATNNNMAKGFKNEFGWETGWIKDDPSGHHINNLFSGKSLGGKGKSAMLGASVIGGGYYAYSTNKTFERDSLIEMQGQLQDIASIPGTQGDMVGYQAYPGVSNLPNIEVGGDLVFALHKTRHGV